MAALPYRYLPLLLLSLEFCDLHTSCCYKQPSFETGMSTSLTLSSKGGRGGKRGSEHCRKGNEKLKRTAWILTEMYVEQIPWVGTYWFGWEQYLEGADAPAPGLWSLPADVAQAWTHLWHPACLLLQSPQQQFLPVQQNICMHFSPYIPGLDALTFLCQRGNPC